MHFQVDVYQSDFNAERAAREKIAGEKADLEETIRKIQLKQSQLNKDIGSLNVRDNMFAKLCDNRHS